MLCPKCKLYKLEFPLERKKKVCFICMDVTDDKIIRQVARETGDDDLFAVEEENIFLHSIQDIIFPQKVWSKMWNYCQLAQGEISGFGKIKLRGEKAIVQDVILLEQKCTASDTVISEDALNEFVYKLAKKGMDTADYRLWWHTHGNGGVFWSITDEENIKRLQDILGGAWCSTVMNKAGAILGRVDEGYDRHELNVIIKPRRYGRNIRNKCHNQVRRLVRAVAYEEVERV